MVKGIKPSALQIGDWSRQTSSRDGLGSGVEAEGQVRAQCNQGETGLASTAEVEEEARTLLNMLLDFRFYMRKRVEVSIVAMIHSSKPLTNS